MNFEIDDACASAWRLYAPTIVPAGWRVLESHPEGGAWFTGDGMSIIASVVRESDGKRWLHVSMARKTRLPSYEDLCRIKDWIVGRDRTALQVFPPKKKHVNFHPYCLHLWSCVDGDVTPDFSRGLGII